MLAIVAALIVATLLCLAFDSTRWLGVVGVVLLFYLHPLLLVVLLVLAVVASLAVYHYLRSSKMSFHDYVIDALEAVLDYGLGSDELADESFRRAVITQACIMARSYLD